MAFCTECGSKLPDDAICCPECGASVTNNKIHAQSNVISSKNLSNPINDTYDSVGSSEAEKESVKSNRVAFSNYAMSTQTSEFDLSTQTSNESTKYKIHEHYKAQVRNDYQAHSDFGYPQRFTGIGDEAPLRNGGFIAAIVISIAVVLLAISGYLIYKASSESLYIGYWESVAINDRSGFYIHKYSDESVSGLIGIQINKNGEALISSVFDEEIFDAKWVKIKNGIKIIGASEVYELIYKNKNLHIDYEGLHIVFEKVDGGINNTSMPRGYI